MSGVDVFVAIVMAIPIVAIALSALAILRWRGVWRLAAMIPVALIAAWVLSVIISWPGEHNLWPFELIVYGLLGLVYMLLLRYAHKRRLARGGTNA